MIKVYQKPLCLTAVQWTGDNEAEIKAFVESFVEGNAAYRIVDGALQITNDSEFPDAPSIYPGRIMDVEPFHFIVRDYDTTCEESYMVVYSPHDFNETFLPWEAK